MVSGENCIGEVMRLIYSGGGDYWWWWRDNRREFRETRGRAHSVAIARANDV